MSHRGGFSEWWFPARVAPADCGNPMFIELPENGIVDGSNVLPSNRHAPNATCVRVGVHDRSRNRRYAILLRWRPPQSESI